MKRILSSPTGRIVFALGLLLAVFLIVLLVRQPALLLPLAITLAVVAAAWWLTELLLRQRQRRRQADFDERLAAREGIEDRRREWSEWTKELERQGIDRYELPFYLLVGEPQAGKSVLLQNSDLHFPFGQSRLSGVGGTKGCDWWFTDEAVVLDLAGRLFVHEGGAADEAEWKAFLELLVGFRPMCPANGILLVVPCDSLLGDPEQKARATAKRIQGALTTLSQSLQAELPVYLVLTKADRIFGFAETVHRLEVDERHQMFGWSRPADRAETAFSLEEARAGFEELVERARELRTRMMASARLPEALPEVDRLYGFPDELANLYPALEIYLRQVFTETSLLDRLFFRGIYLTSGLQAGVPIAKVCRDMLGATGEADTRRLETVFTKQRAYFIKDLVRKRVFAEQGLVRPTERRTLRSRRNALIGLGVAGALALVSVVSSLAYLFQGKAADLQSVERHALDLAESARPDMELGALLRALLAQSEAADHPRPKLEKHVNDEVTRDFGVLYAALFDRYLLPALRQRAGTALEGRLAGEPQDHEEFTGLVDDGEMLLHPIDVGNQLVYERLCAIGVPERDALGIARSKPGPEFDLDAAFEARRHYGDELEPIAALSDPLAGRIRTRLLALFAGVLDSRNAWAVRGGLGYVVAWRDLETQHGSLSKHDGTHFQGVQETCISYTAAVRHLDACARELPGGESGLELRPEELRHALDSLEQRRERVAGDAGAGAWDAARLLRAGGPHPAALFADSSAPHPAPTKVIEALRPEALVRVADPERFEADLDAIAELPADLRIEREKREASPGEAGSKMARQVLGARLRAIEAQWTPEFTTWEALAARLGEREEPPGASPFRTGLVSLLIELWVELSALEVLPYANWISPIEDRLGEYLADWMRERLLGGDEGTPELPEMDWSVFDLLVRLKSAGITDARGLAPRLLALYVEARQDRMLEAWTADPERDLRTILGILEALQLYEAGLARPATEGGLARRGELEAGVLESWLGAVDLHLSRLLDEAREELEIQWAAPLPGAWSSLSQAAKDVHARLTDFELEKKVQPGQDDPDRNLQHGELGLARLSFGEALGQSKPALETLKFALVPAEGIDRRSLKAAESHRAFVSKFMEPGGAPSAGPDLAFQLGERRKLVVEPSDTALQGYVQGVHEAFLARLQSEVQRLYLEEFRSSILDGFPELREVLYARSAEELGDVVDDDVLHDLSSLLDPGGALDDLHGKYKLPVSDRSGVAGFDFRPQELGALNPSEWIDWRFERFLSDLQDFLLATNGKVEGCVFTLVITPASAPGTIWDRATRSATRYFPPKDTKGRLGPSESIPPDEKRSATLTCNMQRGAPHRLRMRWGPNATTEEERPDRGELCYEVESCLAPLLFLWNGEPSKDDPKIWNVAIRPRGAEHDAPFVVRIEDRAPPARPEAPR